MKYTFRLVYKNGDNQTIPMERQYHHQAEDMASRMMLFYPNLKSLVITDKDGVEVIRKEREVSNESNVE